MENALTRAFSSASREKSAGTAPQEASSASYPPRCCGFQYTSLAPSR
ncbi:hypothetical protein RCI35_003741 [Enterobacter hormaechei]|nr:hypothetical protein [Enterobacter hormaechei]